MYHPRVNVNRTVHDQNARLHPSMVLHVEYAERRRKYDILFIFSLFCEYINLGYERVPVIYRVDQAEYAIHIRVAASPKYVNIYSTRRSVVRINPKSTERRVEFMTGRAYVQRKESVVSQVGVFSLGHHQR